MREEYDCLGKMELPDSVYYGIQTQRVMGISNVTGTPVIRYPYLHNRLAYMKKAAALANKAIGELDPEVADAIAWAADQFLQGGYEEHFPLDIIQGGGYTCVNMNMNEVLAHLANEKLTGHKGYDRVHPNTHVNMGQSTNDMITSALAMAVGPAIDVLLVPLIELQEELEKKTIEFRDVIKVGRTCLQDAVPMTLGQEFSGYASFVQRQIENIRSLRSQCNTIIVGATAVGTGMGAFPGYKEAFYEILEKELNEKVTCHPNLFDGMQNSDYFVKVSAAIKQAACGISKIAKDMRILSSGPRAGFGEITLPALSPGSSIMPGKINPIAPEVVMQSAQIIIGNDVVISTAFEQGELEINCLGTSMYKCLFESFDVLTNAIPVFSQKCIRGLVANRDVCLRHANSTLALSTVVGAALGYTEGVRVSHYAHEHHLTVREAVLEMKIMNESEVNLLLDPALLVNEEKMSAAIAEWKAIRKLSQK